MTRRCPHRSYPTAKRCALAAAMVTATVTFMAVSSHARAAEGLQLPPVRQPTPKGVKGDVWSIGLAGTRFSLKADDDNELLGNTAAVQIGRGYVGDNWYVLGSLDIMLGPYEIVRQGQLAVDYFGTGVTVWTGLSAQTLNLRSDAGSYGFALGVTYADIVGRSAGGNKRDSGARGADGRAAAGDAALLETYTMRVTHLALLPAIFFSWLEPARPAGNTPELLATRIEGYLLNFGASIPLVANHQTKLQTLGGEARTESGDLRGYSIVIGLTALLGT